MFFEPQKGKAFDKLPIKDTEEFDSKVWTTSTKFDGNQIFICKKDSKIRWFTSDWKEFSIPELDTDLLRNKQDFIIKAEFMYNSRGMLGDRRKSAILTTLRTCFNKGIKNPTTFKSNLCTIKAFDVIAYNEMGFMLTDLVYTDRLYVLALLTLPEEITKISTRQLTGKQAKIFAKQLVNEGWEGCMCVDGNSKYQIGKRVNYSVKLKYRKTADLLCIDTIPGDGKYVGEIGSLVLQDSEGRIVAVGSGLDDIDRVKNPNQFIGKIIEIEYEQIMDTYIQPVFNCVRYDKVKGD